MTPPGSPATRSPGLLESLRIEIELPLVDPVSLDVVPRADDLLAYATGGPVGEVRRGQVEWTNSLAAHVLEVRALSDGGGMQQVASDLRGSLNHLNAAADACGLASLGLAMHPWMDPRAEAELWGHDLAPVYRAFDRIFDCRRHGWTNVQGIRLGISYRGGAEFGRLMRAVRIVLPWIPALAAASPIEEGRPTGILCKRLVHGRHRADRVPELVGDVIPEPVYDPGTYREEVLVPIARHLSELDPEGELAERNWINGRGAIARFDRSTVQIGLIDVQESLTASVAVASAVASAVQILLDERFVSLASLGDVPTAELVAQLGGCVGRGEEAPVAHPRLARAFGADGASRAGEVWRAILDAQPPVDSASAAHLDRILDQGTLATRLLAALDSDGSREALTRAARELVACFREDRGFDPRSLG